MSCSLARRLVAGAAVLLASFASASPAAASGSQAFVTAAGGDECPQVSTLGLPVEGGCVLHGRVERSELRLITPLGLVPAAYCEAFDFRLVLEGSGSAWIDDVYLSRGDPCGDIRSCEVLGTSAGIPWEGAIHIDRDRSVHIHFDVCWDTCFGRFQGRQRFEVERDGAVWRLVADRAQVDDSAFELEAEWRLKGSRGLEFERASEFDG